MSDSGDPKQDRQRELETEREFYEPSTTPQPDSPEDYPINDTTVSLRYKLDGEWYETHGVAAIIDVLMNKSLLGSLQLSEYYSNKARQEKHRYCGICYKPCIEHGGWECPEHGYQSVYISRQEAKECRDDYYTNKFLEVIGEDEDINVHDTNARFQRVAGQNKLRAELRQGIKNLNKPTHQEKSNDD